MRNILCAHYRSCLDTAARFNLRYWSCSRCRFRNVAGFLPENEYIGESEIILLWAIFKPDLYREFRETERIEKGRTRAQPNRLPEGPQERRSR